MMRAPVIPKGWPRAIAPPNGLSLLVGDPELLLARDDLRREGLVDLDDVDVVDRSCPVCSSSALIAGIGPRPMISGRIAATVEAMIRARGLRPSFSAFSSLITSTAAAPSFSGQALPAVTVPPSA